MNQFSKQQVVDIQFDITNPRAQEFAGRRAANLVTAVTNEQKASLRRILERAYREGRTVQQVDMDIRQIVGLNERQQNALLNYKRGLEEEGLKPARIRELTDKYSDRLLRQRARMIARTELQASSNFGQRELWRQAAEENLLPGGVKRKWIVTSDDRLCPICEPLRGTEVGLHESFPEGEPPLHPGCRCTEGLVL